MESQPSPTGTWTLVAHHRKPERSGSGTNLSTGGPVKPGGPQNIALWLTPGQVHD